MAEKVVRLAAGGAALTALLLGLIAGSPVTLVLKRVVISYLAIYAITAVLAALLRLGMVSGGVSPAETVRKRRKSPGTGGTETADQQ